MEKVSPPEGEVPISWFLLNTEPIETQEEILAEVDYYRKRWVIEEFFKALKSGSKIEEGGMKDLFLLEQGWLLYANK